MFYVYILISEKDQRTYVGFTPDLTRRLEKHNSGLVKSTQHRRPLRILFYETFPTSPEARKRETYWKSGAGRRKLKEILQNSSDDKSGVFTSEKRNFIPSMKSNAVF